MALNTTEQLTQFLSGKEHVLFVFERANDIDAIASATALAHWLEARGTNVDVVSPGFTLPRKAAFLSRANDFRSAFPHLKKFTITVDVQKNGIDELSYDVKDEKLHIYITPKEGFLTREQINTAESAFRYDAIVLMNTTSFLSLGKMYEQNSELFHTVPTLLLDHRPQTEKMANLNIVDLTASSTTELLFNYFVGTDESGVSPDIATALLTGMIANTNSFKQDHIRPHTLERAGKLMHMGADRAFIIKQLYQTKTLSSLKLWGQALAHINHDPGLGLVYSTITRDDFARTGAAQDDLYDIIDELIANSPEAKIILLANEHLDPTNPAIHFIVYTTEQYSARDMISLFQPTGDETVAYCTVKSKSLHKATELLIGAIRNYVQKQ